MTVNFKVPPVAEMLREIKDPLERTKAAHTAHDQLQEEISKVLHVRRDGLEELIQGGMRASDVAEELGVSKSRISQLRSQGAKPERAFFGSGTLTIAIGAKPEQGRKDSKAKYVVSTDSSNAFLVLSGAARALGLDAINEEVPPPGLVNLNRPNLVVLTAPRVLPFLEQVLAADPHLGFKEDQAGWYLVDKTTGVEYRSPSDKGIDQDYGYIGRLPRPDGQGTFLYVAGIHSEGTLGAAEWLAENVSKLYRQLKTKRFSVLLSVNYDKASQKITTVEPLTQIYEQGGA
jgi:predicted XRE-type DNA-binding protein